ncbi:MAG: hypothetical protein MZW92_60315 [Comamonadaceae bacterium]|nr:hypothetical protein [Comamonadaceae bacterium]
MHVDGPKVIVETAEPSAAGWSAATTPARPSWRPTPTSRAPSGTGSRPTRGMLDAARSGQAAPELHARRP